MDEQADRPATLRPGAMVAVMLVVLVLRGGVLVVWFDQLRDDPDAYRAFAQTLVTTGTYGAYFDKTTRTATPSAYRAPLYPLVLAHCERSRLGTELSIALVHLVLGLATVALTLVLGGQIGLGRWSALAALLVGADPILLFHSTRVMSETLATFLAVLSLFCLNRTTRAPGAWNAGLAGGSLALAALCRPVFFVMLALVAAYWLLGGLVAVIAGRRAQQASSQQASSQQASSQQAGGISPGNFLPRLLLTSSFLIIALVVLAPWTIRNWVAFGRPIVATTHGGYTFWLGNHADFYRYLRQHESGEPFQGDGLFHPEETAAAPEIRRQLMQMGYTLPLTMEISSDKYLYRAGWYAIRQEPGMFVRACLLRWGRLWQLVPHATHQPESSAGRAMRYAVGLWYAGVYALALAGCWTLGRRLWHEPWLWGTLLTVGFMLVHTVYWTNMRMRAPLVPVIALVAAAGAAWLAAGRGRKPSTR